MKAGWICFGIAACTFWIPIVGGFSFLAALVLAIVAMATNQIRQGLILFCTTISFALLLVIMIFMFGLGLLSWLGGAVNQAHREMMRQQGSERVFPPPLFMPSPPRPFSDSFPRRHFSPPVTQLPKLPAASPETNNDPAAENFVRTAQLTGIFLGNPSLAVINGKAYELGEEIRLPENTRLRVNAITDGKVSLRGRGRDFELKLKTYED